MKRHKFTIILSFGFLIFLILMIGYGFIMDGKTQDDPINISILVYGNDTERWTSLKQGAEQAEKDYNIVINYVTTSIEDSPEEQKEQIYREISNGAQGLLIAACDSTFLEETVAELVQRLPIIMIETGVNNVETSKYLSADNYKMGKSLAETVMKGDTTKGKVAVISENTQRDSVEKRLEGFTDTLKDYDIVHLEDEKNTLVNESDFKELIKNEKISAVAALDNSTLENLVDVIEATNVQVKVYGIGNTDKIVYYLDQGVVDSIVFQNEFSIGYQGTEQIYKKIANISTGEIPEIAYRIVDKSTMYTRDNQRLLFPLVQ